MANNRQECVPCVRSKGQIPLECGALNLKTENPIGKAPADTNLPGPYQFMEKMIPLRRSCFRESDGEHRAVIRLAVHEDGTAVEIDNPFYQS